MIILRDPAFVGQISDPEIARLVASRFEMLSEDEPYDPDVNGFSIVCEPGDSIEALTAAMGFSLFINRASGIRFGATDFRPSFELIEEHQCCFEMVFVLR